jgi:hypothetical protein
MANMIGLRFLGISMYRRRLASTMAVYLTLPISDEKNKIAEPIIFLENPAAAALGRPALASAVETA